MFEPKPVQKPGIPIEVGGNSNPAIRRAGRLADGWQDHHAYQKGGIEALQDRLDLLARHRREAGREHLPFEISVSGHNTWDLDEVHRLEEMGVTRVNGAQAAPSSYGKGEDRSRVPTTVQAWTDRIKQYADEVIAKI
jgi:alkanesulfonate monooxygenase SsuD/methylene tetrahydromethanopterin reductase-like flavin-dependent oxidoreductase (luciferase family)